MNSLDFEDLLKNRIDSIHTTLNSKGREYSNEQDKLKNFKGGSFIAGQTPREYLWSLLTKHLECIREIVRGDLDDSYADEKIGDAINYLILLEALIKDN